MLYDKGELEYYEKPRATDKKNEWLKVTQDEMKSLHENLSKGRKHLKTSGFSSWRQRTTAYNQGTSKIACEGFCTKEWN